MVAMSHFYTHIKYTDLVTEAGVDPSTVNTASYEYPCLHLPEICGSLNNILCGLQVENCFQGTEDVAKQYTYKERERERD